MFDIFAEDDAARKKMELQKGVRMGGDEWAFLRVQRSTRKMYCNDFLDQSRKAQGLRRKQAEDRRETLKKSHQASEDRNQKVSWNHVEEEEIDNEELPGATSSSRKRKIDKVDYNPLSAEEITSTPSGTKKLRPLVSEAATHVPIQLPYQYSHIRKGPKSVKPSFYKTVDKIKSKFHCSNMQPIGSVIETGNGMFDRS